MNADPSSARADIPEKKVDSELKEQDSKLQSEDSLLLEEYNSEVELESNILDVDILDLQMELFQDLPPPIPEYFDQELPHQKDPSDKIEDILFEEN